jgi:hypothetical protein
MEVRDCEMIRKFLLGHREDKRWSLLGQSFGGFCCITYLSFAYVARNSSNGSPESLREVYITGGLAPMLSQPDEVYIRLFRTLRPRHHSLQKKSWSATAHTTPSTPTTQIASAPSSPTYNPTPLVPPTAGL